MNKQQEDQMKWVSDLRDRICRFWLTIFVHLMNLSANIVGSSFFSVKFKSYSNFFFVLVTLFSRKKSSKRNFNGTFLSPLSSHAYTPFSYRVKIEFDTQSKGKHQIEVDGQYMLSKPDQFQWRYLVWNLRNDSDPRIPLNSMKIFARKKLKTGTVLF